MVKSSSGLRTRTNVVFVDDRNPMVLLVVTKEGNKVVLENDIGSQKGNPEIYHGADTGSSENNVGQATRLQTLSVVHDEALFKF